MSNLPDKVFGIEVKGALERFLQKQKNEERAEGEEAKPEAVSIADQESWILLPERRHGNYHYPNTLVSTAVQHKGSNWNQCHKLLSQQGYHMLSLRQYDDFLSGLKAGKLYDAKGSKLSRAFSQDLFNSILEVREPYRAEWADADFKVLNGVLHILYGHQMKNGKLVPAYREPLEGCPMQDKIPGISLEDWLARANHQGMPPSDVQDGQFYYWFPRSDNNSVAWLWAVAVWAYLYCGRDPQCSVAALGVRPALNAAVAP